MSEISHTYTYRPQPSAPEYLYTQNAHTPITPYSECSEPVTRLPALPYSFDGHQARDRRAGSDDSVTRSLPSPLSTHLTRTETLSGAREVGSDIQQSDSRYPEPEPGRLTPDPPFSTLPLSINNTAQMYELMKFGATPRHCKLTVKTIQGLINCNQVMSARKKKLERDVLVDYLYYWTSMTLHPFIILICTIRYVELLKVLHPSISFTGKLRDAMLRVMFSAFLVATKMVSDVCYANAAFIRHTPWTLEEINSMEAELLVHIQYKLYISPTCLLHRAKSFWAQPQEEIFSSEDDEASFDSILSAYDRPSS